MSHLRSCLLLLATVAGLAGVAHADIVHVIEVKSIDGVVTQLSDTTKETGGHYETQKPPAVKGYIFTHWSTSAHQSFDARDEEGRAWDSAPYLLYEETTFVANYVRETIDADDDGVADGYELYWYGDLDETAESDTDGDGYTLVQELVAGANPHFPDESFVGGVAWGDSSLWLYNPHGYAPYTVRSEPEGALFATTVSYVVPGSKLMTPTCNCGTSAFAYWTMDGVAQRDEDGRAVDAVTFAMPDHAVELAAVCVDDESARAKCYWYGTTDISDDSDTDGDGYSFVEELAAGTNPLFPDEGSVGGVVWRDSELWQYNPHDYRTYVIRSEPEGMFTSVTNIVASGTVIETSSCSPETSTFAYWTADGVAQRDEDGRALDKVSLPMPNHDTEIVAVCEEDEAVRRNLYWYGQEDVPEDSDTDGDGYTYAEELAAGTNPLFPDMSSVGGVVWADSEEHEVNLQPYEQVDGGVIGERYVLFELLGGANLQPVVADVDGDGLWDVVLVYEGGVKVLVNVGAKGNPEFKELTVSLSGVDLTMNSTEKLASFVLDVAPNGALSATIWENILLVSDEEGRIWYYISNQAIDQSEQSNNSYMLQHKVWGGSHAGFAEGLRLAAVDWDDDGDLDCLCGTAEGKLMLLRDPKVGRPTNLRALAGVDNVKLDWDPNAQSRIRGYKVYRTDEVIANPSLPTYRDYPPSVADYDYKVSSVSRHYVAGNSTPIVSESMPTEAIRVSLGKVSLHWTDVAVKRGETFRVMLSIDNSADLSPDGMAIEIEYDRSVLNLLKTLPSGLFDNGKIAPGGGKLYEYEFEVVAGGDTSLTTEVSVVSATMHALNGTTVSVALPEKNAVVSIAASGAVPYQLGDVTGDGKIDKDDLRELAKLKSAAARKWTANQLKAGDYNGNGTLDNDDYQLMKQEFREKGIVNGGEKMGVL